jgi:hypothetical protein
VSIKSFNHEIVEGSEQIRRYYNDIRYSIEQIGFRCVYQAGGQQDYTPVT